MGMRKGAMDTRSGNVASRGGSGQRELKCKLVTVERPNEAPGLVTAGHCLPGVSPGAVRF